MKYKCLIFDHDDTVVNSTATIHHPCFVEYLNLRYPGRTCSLQEYFQMNFDPGFIAMCTDIYGMSAEELFDETEYWREYVARHIPAAYPGIREIMERHRAEGGILAVISHSLKANILRDYEYNRLPVPDMIFGWDEPEEQRKPAPYPVNEIIKAFSLDPDEILLIDDLKPGYDMAIAAGVHFAAAGWANDIESIESFMRSNSDLYFKTVDSLAAFLA